MSNSDAKQLTEVAQVDVQSAWLSKINWGEAIKVICAIAAVKGIDVPPDVQRDMLLAIVGGGSVYTWIVKTWFTKTITPASAKGPDVPTSVVMKILVAALLLSALLAPSARAADVLSPVKAAALPQAYGTSGLYFGIFTEGGGGSVDASVAGVNTASLVTNQIGIGAAVGYAWSMPAAGAFMALEGMGKVNNFNGSAPGFAWNGPASFTERFKIGVPLDKVLAVIPNLGLPTAAPFPVLPAGTTLLNTKSYLFGAFHQDDNSYAVAGLPKFSALKLSGGIGTGVIGQLSNGTALDAWAEVVFANSSRCFGVIKVCANEGNKYLIGLGVWF